MSSSATSATDSSAAVLAAAKHRFLEALAREGQTTRKVLSAYPTDKLELKPSEKNKTARQLAWLMAIEFGMSDRAMQGQPMFGGKPPAPPEEFSQVIDMLAQQTAALTQTVSSMPEAALLETVQFPTGPKQMGEYSKIDFLWFILLDHVHHRGQFSIYTRLAGGHLPSIYGPTADEPWT